MSLKIGALKETKKFYL